MCKYVVFCWVEQGAGPQGFPKSREVAPGLKGPGHSYQIQADPNWPNGLPKEHDIIIDLEKYQNEIDRICQRYNVKKLTIFEWHSLVRPQFKKASKWYIGNLG